MIAAIVSHRTISVFIAKTCWVLVLVIVIKSFIKNTKCGVKMQKPARTWIVFRIIQNLLLLFYFIFSIMIVQLLTVNSICSNEIRVRWTRVHQIVFVLCLLQPWCLLS